MRTNIDLPDDLLDAAMRAGPYKTKKDAVEAGLKLLARQAAYRDILALRGKLHWDDGAAEASPYELNEPSAAYKVTAVPKVVLKETKATSASASNKGGTKTASKASLKPASKPKARR